MPNKNKVAPEMDNGIIEMANKNQVAPEIDKEAAQRLNDLKDNLIIKDGQLILKDEFYIFSKGVSYNGESALWYLLCYSDINHFRKLINTVIETVNTLEAHEPLEKEKAVEIPEIEKGVGLTEINKESRIKSDQINLTSWFINLMGLSPCGTSVKIKDLLPIFRFFPGECFESHDSSPVPIPSLIEVVLSKKSDINCRKFILLMQLIIGYRKDDESASARNEFLEYFYDHRTQKSKIMNRLLDRNHAEIFYEAFNEANESPAAALRILNVIDFIKKCIPSSSVKEKRDDLFRKMIIIMDFVLLKKHDDLINFNKQGLSDEESKNSSLLIENTLRLLTESISADSVLKMS
tara:strand:+ start:2973 stop:4019 length:1047 start_codon:yes stop_codon:yes gene_type:complete